MSPMTEGEALAVDESLLWWLNDAANVMAEMGNDSHVPKLRQIHEALTAHTAASGGEVACWRMRRTNAVTGEWGHATSWQDGAPSADDLSDAERVSPNGRMRYRIEYAYTAPPAAVPADALERLAADWAAEIEMADENSADRFMRGAAIAQRKCRDELAALIPKGADHGQR